jgi:hypothetical protein
MKRLYLFMGLLATIAIVMTVGYRAIAQTIEHRIQTKIARVQAGMDAWTGAGKDPRPIVSIIGQVMPALDKHDPKTAEALLDRALEMLGPSAPK